MDTVTESDMAIAMAVSDDKKKLYVPILAEIKYNKKMVKISNAHQSLFDFILLYDKAYVISLLPMICPLYLY